MAARRGLGCLTRKGVGPVLERAEFALRHWESIRPVSGKQVRIGEADQVVYWIDREVCPLVGDLIRRPDFRGLARWSIDNLQQGVRKPARRCVEAIDAS